MACLDMYNSEHKGHHHHNHHHHHRDPVSPRISFSNDFVDSQQATKQEQVRTSRSETPVSSDFEFSVTNYSMMSADELFFKGRLLPFKDKQRPTTTLREELLMDDDDDDDGYRDFSLRPPKGSSTKWKGFLGLRKSSHLGSKKVDKINSEGSSDRGLEPRRPALFIEDATPSLNLTSQELLNDGGPNCRDVEIGL